MRQELVFEARQHCEEITKRYIRRRLTGTADWYHAVKEIIHVGEEANDNTLVHHFVTQTFAPVSPGFISGIAPRFIGHLDLSVHGSRLT